MITMRGIRRLVLLVALLPLALFPVSAAATTTTGSSVEVFFQHPAKFGAGDNEALVREWIRLFNEPHPTDNWTAYISMYAISDLGSSASDPVDRLLHAIAKARNTSPYLRIKVVADDKSVGAHDPDKSLCDQDLETGTSGKINGWTRPAIRLWCIAVHPNTSSPNWKYFVRCVDSCLGPGGGRGIDHNKFVLFRNDANPAQTVLSSASANWTANQLDNMHQTMVVVRNDKPLADSWYQYWSDLYHQTAHYDGNYHDYFDADNPPGAYYFPRDADHDPELTAMTKLDCSKGDPGKVRIAVNGLATAPIVNQLNAMTSHKDGHGQYCDVQVLVGGGQQRGAFGPHVSVRCVHHMHMKDLTLSGHYNNPARTTMSVVFSGSRSFRDNDNIKYSDNALLHMTSSARIAQYLSEFDLMESKSFDCDNPPA